MNRYFVKGLIIGAVAGAAGLLLALAAWGFLQVRKIEDRMDRREIEVRQRTRPILAPIELPDLPIREPVGQLGVTDWDWSLQSLRGEELHLERYHGTVLVLAFWATWCRPCIGELESIGRLRQELASEQGIVFVAASYEDRERVAAFLEDELEVDLDFVVYDDGIPAVLYSQDLPTAFVIDRKGKVLVKKRGGADWHTAQARRFLLDLVGRCRTDEVGGGGHEVPCTSEDHREPA